MRVLLIADEEDLYLWEHYTPGCLGKIDLILSAGDLKSPYLSFLVTMLNCPLLYVHGNHDGAYDRFPPEGCECVDDRVVTVKGYRIAGLGGCRWYNNGPYQYPERQMAARIRRLRRPLRRAGGMDILLTHAPAEGYGDMPDPVHQGFRGFLDLLDKYQPAFMFHGHVHLRYAPSMKREFQRGGTVIRNIGGYSVMELPDRS